MSFLLIDELAPAVRLECIRSRSLAMMGNSEEALARLDGALSATNFQGADQLYIALCKAEILATDDREVQALEVFREHIDSNLGSVSHAHALIIADNRHGVSTFFENTSGRDFYLTGAARRIADVDLWDSGALLDGAEAAAEGKHYDALPLIWSECLRAYRTGSWRSQVVTARHLARECLQLGAVDEASLQAALGEDEKITESIGDELFKRREVDTVEKTIEKLLKFANLAKHALVACKVFARIVDLIPDSHVEPVFSWLLARSGTSPDDWPKSNSLKAVWEALRDLSPRLDGAQAARLVRAAVSHQVWSTPQSIQREMMLEGIRHVVHKLDPDAIQLLRTTLIPVVTDLRHDRDYVEAVNLACRVVEFGSDAERETLACAMCPNDGKRPNLVLLQVSEHFGHALDATILISFIQEWTQYTRRQVERLKVDEEVLPVPGGLGHFAKPQGDHKIIVHESSGLAYGAIVRLRHSFTPQLLEQFTEAALAMIREPENFLHNKELLVDCLGDLADCFSPSKRSLVLDAIAPLATAAPIQEPTIVQTAAVVDHPMNPFRYQRGTPGRLRRSALEALAKIESVQAGSVTQLRDTIEAALVAGDIVTRRAGFAAAQELRTASRSLLTALLMGTRDGDREICARAIYALASMQNLELSENEGQLLLHSLRLAAVSEEQIVRRAVAQSLSKLEASLPQDFDSDLRSLKEALRVDVCYSVRRSFEKAPSAEG